MELGARRSPSALVLPCLFLHALSLGTDRSVWAGGGTGTARSPVTAGSPTGPTPFNGDRGPKEAVPSREARASRSHVTERTPHPLPSPVDLRPRGKASGRPGCDGTRLTANQRRARPPTPSPSHPRLSRAAELVLRPATHEETTLTFRVRHVAPHSVRAAWATTEGASTHSRRPQAAPLKPAHLCDAGCVLRRGAGGRGQAPGAEPEARADHRRNFIGWLAPAPPAIARPRVRFGTCPALGSRCWRRMRSPPRLPVACGRGPDHGSLTFPGFDAGLGTPVSRKHSVNSPLGFLSPTL